MFAGWTRLRWVCLIAATTALIAILLNVAYLARTGHERRFAEVTGFQLPSSATVVAAELLETGPMGSDGMRGVEFQVDAQTIDKWLKEKPFRGAATWGTGRIRRGMILGLPMPPTAVMSSPSMFHAVHTDEQNTQHLLVVEPKLGQVWLISAW
jgi:hypothetical protein